MLVAIGLEGRDGLVGGLMDLVAAARAGTGGSCWVEGEPGIGKTAVLHELTASAPPDITVLRATGRESESELAWAGLGALLAPLVAAGFAHRLSVVQRAALLGVLALAVPEGPIEPYAVLSGAEAVVRAAAGSGPLLLVVDDVQWLDEQSRLAVEFLAPRLEGTAVALVAAGRPEPDRRPPVPPTLLGPVDATAADALLEHRGVASPSVRRRIVEEMEGNPLLLHAAADALGEAQRQGVAPLPEVLPIPHSALQLAARRIAAVEPAGRTALLVASITPGADVATVAVALEQLGGGPDDLAVAEEAGLVELDGGAVRFTHPTIRSAAYHAADGARRRAAHLAVAEALADPVSRAWHRGLGELGPDDEVADDLERTGLVLRARAAPMAAARHFELAARLSSDGGDGARRLRLAAEGVVEQGHEDVAEALLDRADTRGGGVVEAARRRRLRLRLALRAGQVDESVRDLRALADEIGDEDPRLAAELLLDAAAPLVRRVRPVELLEVAQAAAEWAAAVGDEQLVRRADVTLGVAQLALGDLEGQQRLARYREVLDEEGAVEAGVFLAEVVGPVLSVFLRTPEAEALLDDLERNLRDLAAAPVLVSVLTSRAIATHPRDLPGAVGYAREAVELATGIGRPALGLLATSSLVIAAGLIGDREQTTRAAATLLDAGEPGLAQAALIGLGILHLGHGELDEALAAYERLDREIGMNEGVTRWEPDWCEALIRARRPADAQRVLDAASGDDRAVLGAGGFSRIRGLLAEDPDEADGCFEEAVAWFQLVGNRVGEARTELAWGERLRRARRRAAAREHLERAAERFEEVGAAVWTGRARKELGAAAGTHSSGVEGVDALTAQELEIARLAATGATNQEIGTAVFLSPRTVETHLGAAFRKLGIRNRRQLVAMAAEEPRLRP